MAADDRYANFRRILRTEIRRLISDRGPVWNRPIVEVVATLKEAKCPAVFFGGSLRSLVMSKYWGDQMSRPRDIDLVVQGESIEKLRERFKTLPSRENRFGGLHIRNRDWLFDIWPLGTTWAFRNDGITVPEFSDLPATTFFNIEAIAMDVWVRRGQPRIIHDGAGQFYDGIASRTVEINKEDNPFPGLCVARALVFAFQAGFGVGPRLARYIAQHGGSMTGEDIERVQIAHYGAIRIREELMREWIDYISRRVSEDAWSGVILPRVEQMRLWPDPPVSPVRIVVQSLR